MGAKLSSEGGKLAAGTALSEQSKETGLANVEARDAALEAIEIVGTIKR